MLYDDLYLYALSTNEFLVYFSIWALHSFFAFMISFKASYKLGNWLDHWLEPSSYINGIRMDNSDVEWKLFRMSFATTSLALLLNSVVLKVIMRLRVQDTAHSLLRIMFWFALHIYLSSMPCVLMISAIAIAFIIVTAYTRNQWFIWPFVVIFISRISSVVYFSKNPSNYYREFNLYLYSAIKIVNVCIYLVRNPSKMVNKFLLLDFLEYMLYPPYSIALIILFEDFQKQLSFSNQESSSQIKSEYGCRSISLNSIIYLTCRLIFWFFILEILLHLCSVNALFNSPFTMLKSLNNYEIVSIAYVAGQLFHLKYIVIFGLPSLFATIDGMTPPEPPICISRVSKYSHMWRYFDHGLYKFLKNQIYVPLVMQKSLSTAMAVRKFLAMISVFLFVLIWHGFGNSNYFWWISLSALELSIERIVTEFIWPYFQTSTSLNISTCNFIRLKAFFMLATVIPGIFGIFFFLGRAEVGHYIFTHVLIQGFVDIFTLNIRFLNAGWVMLHLLLMGYAFNHVCIFFEQSFNSIRKKHF